MTLGKLNSILLFLCLLAFTIVVLTDCGPQQYVAKKSVSVKVWQEPCKVEVLADDVVRCTVAHPTKGCQFSVKGEAVNE